MNDYAELLLQKGVYPTETPNGTALAIDGEYDEIENIVLITSIVRRLSKANKEPFFTERNATIQPTSSISNSLFGMLLSQNINLKHQHPNHTFNPHVDLFNSITEKHGLDKIKDHLHCRDRGKIREVVETLNRAVGEIRSEMQKSEFRTKIINRRRRSQKNKKSILDYIKSLFQQPNNSTLLIVRIDCAYKARLDVPYEEVRAHRERLLAYLRSKFKNDFLGYVAKLEYGLKKRYHYHWIIILNGNRLRRDVAIGALIGNHWNNEVTQGAGVYFNCNANKNSYQLNCIGIARHNSVEFWKGADKLAAYLVKADYHLSAILPVGHRSLWRGERSAKERSTRGRKRLPSPEFLEDQV